MQELLQEFYPEEERETLFSLDQSKFQNILSEESWIKLQQEFETQHNALSPSYLIWTERSGQQWMLTDFGKDKTYYIDSLSDVGTEIIDEGDTLLADVSELPGLNKQLSNPQTICKLLRDPQTKQEPQGTLSGFITLMMKLDLEKINLDELKRSDLSGSKLDFHSFHQGLVVIHGFFREILTSSGVNDINLSDAAVQTVRQYLPQFYEIADEIEGFNVMGENPTKRHEEISKKIFQYCRDARSALDPIIAYLRSTQIKKSQTEFNTFYNGAVRTWKKFDDQCEERLEELDELKIERENQLAATSISDHVKFFDRQAGKHQKGAQSWLWGSVCLGLLSILIFFWLLDTISVQDNTVPAVLQGFFTKGFLLSVFYIFLNRSVKNYTAEKHLEVVNLHRRNALATFEAFAKAAGNNPDTRDQVLLASTGAIFDANQSGYISTKTSRPDSSHLIQQMFRSIVPDKQS